MDDHAAYLRLSREAIELAEEWRWESRGRTLVQEAQKLLNWEQAE
jgi:hypothetical protein